MLILLVFLFFFLLLFVGIRPARRFHICVSASPLTTKLYSQKNGHEVNSAPVQAFEATIFVNDFASLNEVCKLTKRSHKNLRLF